MTDDEFDAMVIATVDDVGHHLNGRPLEVVVWALCELLMAPVRDEDDLRYIQDVLDQIGLRPDGVTLQ